MRSLVALGLVLLSFGRVAGQGEPPPRIMSLQEAAEIALQGALTIRAAQQSVRVAEGSAQLSRGTFDPLLAFSPTITSAEALFSLDSVPDLSGTQSGLGLTASLTGNTPISTRYSILLGTTQRAESPLLTQAFGSEFDNTLSFTLTQPVFRGFGAAAGLNQQRAAEASLSATRERYNRQVEETLATVEVLYFALARREQEQAAARESLARAEQILSDNIELRALGRISRLDSLTSESGAASRRSQVTTTIRNRENAADGLIALIYGERAPEQLETLGPSLRTTYDEGTVSLGVPELPTVDSLTLIALQRRPDVLAARYDVAQHEWLLGNSRNAVLPQLDLSGTFTALGQNTPNAFDFQGGRTGAFRSEGWSAGLTFSWPILNRTAKGAVEQSRGLTRQSELFLVLTENDVRTQVRAAHRGVRLGAQASGEAADAYRLTLEQYAGEQERKRLGLTDSFRLLQVEEQVTAGALDFVAARFALYASITTYKLAIGGVLIDEYGGGR
jgi:outer membrane protein TolC